VQPDADVLMIVSPKILDRPDLWQAHMEKLVEKIDTIHRFKGILKLRSKRTARVFFPKDVTQTLHSLWHAPLPLNTVSARHERGKKDPRGPPSGPEAAYLSKR
jgi:hypothetical protein